MCFTSTNIFDDNKRIKEKYHKYQQMNKKILNKSKSKKVLMIAKK